MFRHGLAIFLSALLLFQVSTAGSHLPEGGSVTPRASAT